MLKAAANESLEQYLARLENSKDEWPRSYQCRFIEPGLVNYAEYGNVLVQKPVLDKMCNSFVGKPVINLIHKEVSPSMYENGEADGVVTRVWYNDADGWYWCDFLVWDDSTRLNCESDAYSVSCAYTVSDINSKPGEYHNIAYEQEVLDGEYTHLAVVANPRYEGARIVYNSKGGTMKLFKFWKKSEAKNAAESDLEKAVVDVDGQKVAVKALIEAHNSLAKKGLAVENMSDDTIIEVDGQELPLKNLKDSYRAVKNAEDDEEKKKKAKDDEDMKNADDEAKKKKDEEDLKNAEEDAKKKKDDDEKMENEKRFRDLKNAAERRGEPQKAQIVTRRELAAVGREKYGKKND